MTNNLGAQEGLKRVRRAGEGVDGEGNMNGAGLGFKPHSLRLKRMVLLRHALRKDGHSLLVSDDEVSCQIPEADVDPTVLITFEELVAESHLRGD